MRFGTIFLMIIAAIIGALAAMGAMRYMGYQQATNTPTEQEALDVQPEYIQQDAPNGDPSRPTGERNEDGTVRENKFN